MPIAMNQVKKYFLDSTFWHRQIKNKYRAQFSQMKFIVVLFLQSFQYNNNFINFIMGKSLRSKVKKRWRSLKRNYLSEVAVGPQLQVISKKLQATVVGLQYRQPQKQNAFIDPQNPNAQFPQFTPQKMIDLRSTSIPGSGREYAGASRKHMMKTKQINEQGMRSQDQIQQEIKIDRSLIKKDKNKKSKLRKQMVF